MKRIFPIIIFILFYSALSGQTKTNAVSGKIIEATTKLPLEFAFVSILQPNDSLLVSGTVTDKNGAFKLDSLSDGKYYLIISLLGYDTISTPEFSLPIANGGNDLGKIFMKTSGLLLDDVQITEEKSTYVNTIDRKVYFPEKDIQAQTGSASDVLQNVPSITVDEEGGLSLRGSANVTILINGKPSQLMNANAAAALQQIPASSIERIEIITNPSAKYKPDGVAGIINIVLKKNAKLGFNGSVTINASTLDRYNGSLNLNYSTGKFNISGSYGFRQNYNQRLKTDTRTFRDSIDGIPSNFLQSALGTGRSYSHTLNFGMDYNLNKNNSIGLEGSYLVSTMRRTQNISTFISDTSGTISDYKTVRNDIENGNEAAATIKFDHAFKKEDHEISFDAGWGNNGELEDSHYRDNYFFPYTSTYDGHTAINRKGNNYTANCNYINPISEDMKLEMGYEGEFLRDRLTSSSEHYDPTQLNWLSDNGKNNTFLFRQDVHAVYGTYSIDIHKFSFMGGLRAEQTFITSNLLTLDSIIPNNYFKIYPTAHFLYKLNDSQQMSLSYSHRVNRPDPDELNPFPEYKDPRNLDAGNPKLKPEQIHSVELGYQIKNNKITFIPSLYYRYTYDAFAEISRYINDTVLLTRQDNLATSQSTGLEFVFSWKYSKLFNLNFSSNIFYNTIDASNLGYAAKKSNTAWDAKLASNFNLGKTTKFQLNGNYRSSMLTAQGHTLPVFFVNAGFKQDIFKKRASLTITASDIFNTQRWVEIIDTPILYQELIRKRKSQFIFIGFSWRFGMIGKKSSNDMLFDNKM